jgi:hypothetical protein
LRWGETESTWYVGPLIGLLYQPRMIDDGKCGAVRGTRIGKGDRSTRRKRDPVKLSTPQIPNALPWT